MSELKIIMYHYVREIKNSKFPDIKGLEVSAFRRQLDYFAKNHSFVTGEQVVLASKGKESLPDNSVWLTFDDGYKDHHSFVMPELIQRGIQGTFFVPSKPVLERTVLDVNSIHYILASGAPISAILERLNSVALGLGYSTRDLGEFRKKFSVKGRFDSPDVVYFKRMLQHALPAPARHAVTDALLKEFVNLERLELAESLYLSIQEVHDLVSAGMYVGGHGHEHLWMEKESYESQLSEINHSLRFLSEVGASDTDWLMAYPYGSFNEDTKKILSHLSCKAAVTTEVRAADLKSDDLLALPRFDTNDFPS